MLSKQHKRQLKPHEPSRPGDLWYLPEQNQFVPCEHDTVGIRIRPNPWGYLTLFVDSYGTEVFGPRDGSLHRPAMSVDAAIQLAYERSVRPYYVIYSQDGKLLDVLDPPPVQIPTGYRPKPENSRIASHDLITAWTDGIVWRLPGSDLTDRIWTPALAFACSEPVTTRSPQQTE